MNWRRELTLCQSRPRGRKNPDFSEFRRSVLCLARVGERLLDPIFGVSDAVGSVMRRRIEPVVQPIKEYLECLSGHE